MASPGVARQDRPREARRAEEEGEDEDGVRTGQRGARRTRQNSVSPDK